MPAVLDDVSRPCAECNGTGWLEIPVRDLILEVECPLCGPGWLDEDDAYRRRADV